MPDEENVKIDTLMESIRIDAMLKIVSIDVAATLTDYYSEKITRQNLDEIIDKINHIISTHYKNYHRKVTPHGK